MRRGWGGEQGGEEGIECGVRQEKGRGEEEGGECWGRGGETSEERRESGEWEERGVRREKEDGRRMWSGGLQQRSGQSQELLLKVVVEQERGWASCSRIQMQVCQEEQRRDVGCDQTAGSPYLGQDAQTSPSVRCLETTPLRRKQENTGPPTTLRHAQPNGNATT